MQMRAYSNSYRGNGFSIQYDVANVQINGGQVRLDGVTGFRVTKERGSPLIVIINGRQYQPLNQILNGDTGAEVDVTVNEQGIEITQRQNQASCCLWLKIATGALMCSASVALLIFFPHLVAASLGLKFALGGSFFTGLGLFAHGCYQRSSAIELRVEQPVHDIL